jgi:hypothetical protein
MYKLLVIIAIFLLGLYFIYHSNNIEAFTSASDNNVVDASGNSISKPGGKKMSENCPDVLIQKGAALFLYNSKRASVPGVNPIRFSNLDEYTEFTEWQRSQGILCPILFLQHAYNAQGEPVYKARPSPTNLQGGLPDYYVNESILGNMFNNSNPNIMPPPACVPVRGFSGNNNIDNIVDNSVDPSTKAADCADSVLAFNSTSLKYEPDTPLDNLYNSGVSPNPMDTNWGGIDYTEKLVQSGYYKGNEVSINV